MAVAGAIRSLKIRRARFPLETPFRSAVILVDAVHLVIVELMTEDGVPGIAYGFGFSAADAGMIEAALSACAELTLDQSVLSTAALWTRLTQAMMFVGNGGPALAALSVLDMAAWDAKARLLGQPMHRLLGGARSAINAYASAGSIALDPGALADEMSGFSATGFKSFKLKIGRSQAQAVARVQAVRQAVGEDSEIYVDANQQMSAATAVQLSRALEPFRLGWIEEPLPSADIERLADARRQMAVPIATGETNFGLGDFAHLISARAADILMPNLQRIGGITAWLRIAEAASLQGISMASHVNAHFALPLLCGVANAVTLEYVPWWPNPFEQEIQLNGGDAIAFDQPGFGVSLDEARLRLNPA